VCHDVTSVGRIGEYTREVHTEAWERYGSWSGRPLLAAAQEVEVRISLDAKDAPVVDVVHVLAEAGGLQTVFDPGIDCRLTLSSLACRTRRRSTSFSARASLAAKAKQRPPRPASHGWRGSGVAAPACRGEGARSSSLADPHPVSHARASRWPSPEAPAARR